MQGWHCTRFNATLKTISHDQVVAFTKFITPKERAGSIGDPVVGNDNFTDNLMFSHHPLRFLDTDRQSIGFIAMSPILKCSLR